MYTAQGLYPISGGRVCVIKPRSHRGIIFLQTILVWETKTVVVTSKCDVCNLSISGIQQQSNAVFGLQQSISKDRFEDVFLAFCLYQSRVPSFISGLLCDAFS